MIHKIDSLCPLIDSSAHVAWNAQIAGDVTLGKNCSVWFSATIRGDVAPVIIGNNSNIQDNAVIHVDTGIPCIIEDNVTIGHGAILHSCLIGNGTTVGMGAIVLTGAKIGKNSLVAAGSLIAPGKTFPDNTVLMGSPARVIREVSPEENAAMKKNAAEYAKHGKDMDSVYERIDT